MKRPLFSIFDIVGVTMAMTCSLALFTACDDDDDGVSSVSGSITSSTGTINGYEYVDLGLSVKWAMCNIGASSPSDYGNYYAWGETETKNEYTNDSSVTYGDSSIDDFSGNATYDAATANLGSSWRMPTQDECQELTDNCTWQWGTYGATSVKGYFVTGSNGNSIFLPAAGSRYGTSLDGDDEWGRYWSSSLDESDSDYAVSLNFYSDDHYVGKDYRYHGLSIRPVSE